MATKLIDRIAFDYGKFKFNMLVDTPITIIGGDSSSGKTLFCDSLSSYSRIKWPNTFGFLNYRSEEVSFTLRKFRNKVVVIDNADIILSDEDIKYIIPHQSNLRILTSMTEKIGASLEQMFIRISNIGNIFNASIPIVLNEVLDKKLLKENDKIILVGYGGGLNLGSILIEI